MAESIIIPKDNRQRVVDRLCKHLLALPAKAYQVDIKAFRRSRTVQQNRYLFGVAYKLLGDKTGYGVDDLHEYCCGRFWGWTTVRCPRTENNPAGVKDEPIRTTTRNEKGERDVISWELFSDFVASVQQLGSEAGVLIPDPDPELRSVA